MLWSFAICQKKASADQHHVPRLRAQFASSLISHVFTMLTADQILVSRMDRGLKPVNPLLLWAHQSKAPGTFRARKARLGNLYLNAERCIRLKLLVGREQKQLHNHKV